MMWTIYAANVAYLVGNSRVVKSAFQYFANLVSSTFLLSWLSRDSQGY